MDSSTVALNPDVYLNHLAPDKATQSETARDVYLIILGVGPLPTPITLLMRSIYQIAVWDVLVYIPEDFWIVVEGFSAVTFCFIFSR